MSIALTAAAAALLMSVAAIDEPPSFDAPTVAAPSPATAEPGDTTPADELPLEPTPSTIVESVGPPPPPACAPDGNYYVAYPDGWEHIGPCNDTIGRGPWPPVMYPGFPPLPTFDDLDRDEIESLPVASVTPTASPPSASSPATLPTTGGDTPTLMVAALLFVAAGVGARRVGRDRS